MQSTLIIAGIAFVGAAIVGGGLVAFKVEIPLVDSLPRQVLLGTFGLALLVTAFVVDGDGEDGGDERPAAVESTASQETEPPTSAVGSSSAATTIEDPSEWTLVIDGGSELGVSVPSDWASQVTEDAIWASPDIDEWMAAVEGLGPSTHAGYYVQRIMQPEEGTLAEIAQEYLKQMPVPEQCAMTFAFSDPIAGAAFHYRIYECAPGGSYVNEVEVGINPPWVTLESSRYLDEQQREKVLATVWDSLRTY